MRLVPRGAIAQLGERLHGMQEVVGSSPTSSSGKSLQMGMFWTGGRGAWKRSGAFMEALAPDEAPFHASARWIQA